MADISKITIESGTYDVKDEVCRNDTNFYDEITYVKKRANNTDYFLTYIPLNDSSDNMIPIKVSEIEENSTPNKHAIDNVTNVTLNATLSLESSGHFYDGIVIGDGVVLNDYDVSSLGTDEVYLGFKEDRSYKIYARNTTSSAMLADGVKNAFLIFGQCVIEGAIVDDFTHHLYHDADQYIGIKLNKDIVILTCDGRNSRNAGLNYTQASTILLAQGCYDVFALDGGGSTSTSFRCMKLNNNIDNNGINDRYIPYVLDVIKPKKIKATSQIYSNLGKIKQIVNNDTMGLLNNKENKHQVQRARVDAQTLIPTTTGGALYTNYSLGTPYSSLIDIIDGVISLNLPEQQASNLPYYIKLSGNICILNNTNANTSILIHIIEDSTILITYRTTCGKDDYVTFTINNTIASISSSHTYKIMIDAGNTDGDIRVQDKGELTVEYIPNDNTYIG